MHALRFPFAAGSGLLVTLAVFTLLWTFVSRPIDVGTAIKTHEINFTKQRFDTPVATKRKEKIKRDLPPIVPSDPGIHGQSTGVTPVRYEPVKVIVEPGRGGSGLPIGQDREVLPIVRVPPDYPAREAEKGVEGWVKVQFSITAIGTVRDAIVVDGEPKGAFDDAALKAIARWRYNPKIEGGVPVERVGLQTVIRFQLQ
jgi:protein TonB